MSSKDTLEGKTIIVTRPLAQAQNILLELESRLATTVHFPTISIDVAKNLSAPKQCLQNIDQYELIIFISANAVHHAMTIAKELSIDLQTNQLVAIGPATRAALNAYNCDVSIVPQAGFTSEALLLEPDLQNLSHQKILIIRGVGGREYLGSTLRSRGAIVDYAEVYERNLPLNRNPIDLAQLTHACTAVLLYSVESAQNLWSLCTLDEQQWLTNVTYIVGSERIAKAATRVGFANDSIIAENPSDQAMLNALLNWPITQ